MKTPIHVVTGAALHGEHEPRELSIEGARLAVLGIADRWYDKEGRYFKLRAEDGAQYLVYCAAETRRWYLIRRWLMHA